MGAADEAAYWIAALDDATRFMAAAGRHPVAESLEPVVPIVPRAAAAGVRLVCLDTPHPAGRARDHRLRVSNVEPLLAAAAAFADAGYTLVIEDALRSVDTQRATAASSAVIGALASVMADADPRASDERIVERLAAVVAATPKTAGHVAGAAVDVSVRDTQGRELDRGARYLDLSARMPMASPFVSEHQRAARALISEVMDRHGFAAYPAEFWHYSRGDALAAVALDSAEAAVFGPVHVADDGRVTAVQDVHAPLNEAARIVAAIRSSMRRER